MEKDYLVRFGVAMPQSLMEQFDRKLECQGYANRSEAIRDLVRKSLLEPDGLDAGQQVAGTVVLVYDHHAGELPSRLMELQHEHHHDIVSNLHIHLNHDQCLEVIVVRGRLDRLRRLHQAIQILKGVLFAELSVTHAEQSCGKDAGYVHVHGHEHGEAFGHKHEGNVEG